MDYSIEQLVKEWRVRKGLDPLRTDADCVRYDAFDIDLYARWEIESRYERMLATAPLEMLVAEDITGEVELLENDHGVLLIQLPDDCRRLVEVKMLQWCKPAQIVDKSQSELRLKWQVSPFSRAGVNDPLAVIEAGNRVRLYSVNGDVRVDIVMGVVKPPDGVIRCRPVALDQLLDVGFGNTLRYGQE